MNIPPQWEKWCRRGRHSVTTKRRAVSKCQTGGQVKGYFSKLPLNPNLKHTASMYPSVEHLKNPEDNTNVAVETRIINDMKSHLTEEEFWMVIEHLFVVGRGNHKIKVPFKCLRKGWRPERNYK